MSAPERRATWTTSWTFGWTALLSLLFIVKQWDPDVWWHLATGRWMVEHHAILHRDPFSFTRLGAPWTTIDWLADLLLFASFHLGHSYGLALFSAGCAFITLSGLTLALREMAIDRTLALAAVTCCALLVQVRFAMCRPLALGAAFAATGLYLCARAWQRRDRSAVAFIPLIAAWTFIHPSVLIGLFELAALTLALWIDRRAAAQIAHAAATSLVSAVLVGLLGRGMWTHALDLGNAPLALALTLEWQRSSLGDPRLLIPAMLLASTLLFNLRQFTRVGPFWWIAAVGALLSSRYVRNVYEATLLGTPLFALSAQRLGERYPAQRRAVALSLGLLLPALHLALAPHRNFDSAWGVGFDRRYTPVETFAAFQSLPPGRIIHDCTLGGFLIWQGVPVYCDGRLVALYDNAAIEELLLPLYRGGDSLLAVAARYGASYALALHDSDFERGLMRSTAWVGIAYDRETSLFVQRSKVAQLKPEMLLDELRFVNDANWLEGWYGALLSDPTRRARLDSEIGAAMHRCRDSPTLRAVLVYLQRTHPEYTQALRQSLERTIER